MVPATAVGSLVWTVSTLVICLLQYAPPSQAALYDSDRCCSCPELAPTLTRPDLRPQVMPSPFTILVDEDEYRPGREIHVRIRAQPPHAYRAFYIGAYKYPYRRGDMPVGKMKLDGDQDIQVKEDCNEREGNSGYISYALSSADEKPKRNLNFKWSFSKAYGHIEFRATFIVDDEVYWQNEKSKILADPSPGNPPLPRKQFTAPINVETCGQSKGCFRHPAGCVEPQCEYILTWTSNDANFIEFELGGLTDQASDRYVAVGLSDDTYMGDDTVFVCAHNSANDRTEVFLSRNQQDPKKSILIPKYEDTDDSYSNYQVSLYRKMRKEEGSYQNGRLRCRFEIQRDLSDDYPELEDIRGVEKHLLFARGYASRGQVKRHGLSVQSLPIASDDKIDLGYPGDHSGRASYPLAKAHGCLMILAWIFFASISLIMSKYYTTMWPNQLYFNQKYWYIVHFSFMSMMFIIAIIAIILIFIEADGYSEAPVLPQKAHPILGIIILVCILIIPIIALIRPSEEHKCRPLFNWLYWVFWTIAYCLAIPNIFIGMDFGKVGVPWWATWILVIWVIFHIAVEITLEIHQCCTYKKNKDRRKKWEQMKREYPKQTHPEPEPAGRRFKRFMLCLHVCFTTLITIIMIIIIAVC